MEDALVHYESKNEFCRETHVLILVVMEDALVQLRNKTIGQVKPLS